MLNTPYNDKKNCTLKMCKDKVNHHSDLSNVELDPSRINPGLHGSGLV